MPKLEIKANEDRTEALIEIDGVPLKAGARQLDGMIDALVAVRAQLQPPAPTHPPSDPVEAIIDPHYYTKLDSLTGMSLLMLRHPGLGWQSFLLPAKERERLVRYLVQQSHDDNGAGRSKRGASFH